MRINPGPPGSEKEEPAATRPQALKGWRQPARAQNRQNGPDRQVRGVSRVVCVEPTRWDMQLGLTAVRFALTASQWHWLLWRFIR
jgi:hypothetical protein